jgi:DNA-binding winged helix-turn-helix (wHTH) protein
MPNKASIFRFADIEVREREFSLIKAGEALPVEPKAFRVLLILLRNPQKLITKEELLNSVWGDVAVGEGSLTRSIWVLRRLLGDETHNPRYIETVATVGYRWLCKIDVSEEASGEAEPSPEPARLRKNLPKWLIPTAAIFVAGLALALWYACRPLPPPWVTQYNPITHDGHIGSIAGTDGSRIYFNMFPWGPVAQVAVTGGDISPVPIGLTRAQAVNLSADGASLLLWSADPNRLWTVETLGGSPRLLADATGRCSASWSPDTKYIAYSDCHGTLFAMRSDGTDVRKLATVKGNYLTDTAWSPDASVIRFTQDDALWEITSTGGNLHPVLPDWKGPPGQCCGRWTPDGNFYFFLAGGNTEVGAFLGGFEQIWVRDERHPLFRRVSRDPLPLTSGPTRWETTVPSRDGGKIFAVGTTPRGELARFDSGPKRFNHSWVASPRSLSTSRRTGPRSPMLPTPTASCGVPRRMEQSVFSSRLLLSTRRAAAGRPTERRFCSLPSTVPRGVGFTRCPPRVEIRACLFPPATA